MTSIAANPVRLNARLDAPLSRWLWLVKWLLAIPHIVVLALLWIAFTVLSVVAFVAILFTGRYPRQIFDFNVGVLRWTWRVGYYTYGALGTDRYPPFTIAEVPDYPATLDIAYPEHLSRGLVLVKWWLLAIPHYLIIAVFLGGGTYAASQQGTVSIGLVGLLALIAGVALLFTGRYPGGVFDLLLGMNRWVLRVAAYAALMTDTYPPFRLDLGGTDPNVLAVASDMETTVSPPQSPWSVGRIVSVVAGSVLLLGALGMGIGAAATLTADQAGRDADGFLGVATQRFTSGGHALVFDPVELRADAGGVDIGAVLGDVRIGAEGAGPVGVFVGVGPAAMVDGYLRPVERERLVAPDREGRPAQQRLPGGAPATPPTEQAFWAASAAGTGQQQLIWHAAAGDWAVVVMNADGSKPVVADLSAAVTAPGLRWVWTVLFWGAGITLVAGALLVALGFTPRRR